MERKVCGAIIEHGLVQPGLVCVKIDSEKNVLELATEIGNQLQPRLSGHRILIWLLNDELEFGNSTAEHLRARLGDSTLSSIAKRAEPLKTVGSIIRTMHHPDIRVARTDIIAEIPLETVAVRLTKDQAELNDIVGVLTYRYKRVIDGANKGKSPSVNAKSTSYNEHQGDASPILDGRYNPATNRSTVAPPIELYHPAFAQFLAKLADTQIEPPEKIVRDTASLMRSSSAIQVSEKLHTLKSRVLLSQILQQSFLKTTNLDGTSADHIALCVDTTVAEAAAVVIIEEKSELGAGGSEPSVQGSFSYVNFWADQTHEKIRETCCCPSFVVGLAGPWLVIAGAVFTSQVIVQRLTDYIWLGNSRVYDDGHVLRIAHILHALRSSAQELKNYYTKLKPQPLEENKLHPRYFPSITSYRRNNKNVRFTYSFPLESDETCVTFLATLDTEEEQKTDEKERQKVVVKFVRCYGEKVHRILARHGLAPELLYFGPIGRDGVSYGDLQMVVMEFIDGETVEGRYKRRPLPQEIKKALKKGLDVLHKDGFVYGDLRRPNIMIADGTGEGSKEEDIGKRVRFIDFDWAGMAGEVRYPLHLASHICKAAGVSEYDFIQKVHDVKMLATL